MDSLFAANGKFNPNETRGKVISCKGAVVWGPGQPFVMEKVQVDPPQKMEVRVKILFTSICHTDLSAWKGENEAQRAYPRILGHEAAGIIESVGEGVVDMKEGDHVIPIFNGECGDCAYCKSEKTNLCQRFRVNPMKVAMENDGKTRFWTLDGRPIYHFLNTSTFIEYTVLDLACVVKIDPHAHLRNMSLLSCGVSTGNADFSSPSSLVPIPFTNHDSSVCQNSETFAFPFSRWSTRFGNFKLIGESLPFDQLFCEGELLHYFHSVSDRCIHIYVKSHEIPYKQKH